MLDDTSMIFFYILWVLAFAAFIHCFWFAIRYDKDSNQFTLLFVLNVFYLPFYYLRMQRLKTEMRIEAQSEEILDKEFLNTTRDTILEILEIWASKQKQIEFQEANNKIKITQPLLEDWDTYYKIDRSILDQTFEEKELTILDSFDIAITKSQDKLNQDIPSLNEFQKSNDWQILNSLASNILKEIK